MTKKEASDIANNKRRVDALENYYKDPVICLNCEKIIPPKKGQSPSWTKNYRKFCCLTCSASYNNRVHPKRKATPTSECYRCGETISLIRKSTGGYRKRKYCDTCLPIINRENARRGNPPIETFTYGEVKQKRYHGGYWSYRNSLTDHARKIYNQSERPKQCHICGYSTIYHVCHLHDIALFPDDTLISEINALDNLVALCPNHHEEFDRGLREVMGILKTSPEWIERASQSKLLQTKRIKCANEIQDV